MTIDEAFDNEEGFEELKNITKHGKSDSPRCFHNGQYHYRTVDKKDGVNYCALSDTQCPYYERVKNKELCTTKVYNEDRK